MTIMFSAEESPASTPRREPSWPCGYCGNCAYLCERPRHGAATWAIHCERYPHHNVFSTDAPDALRGNH